VIIFHVFYIVTLRSVSLLLIIIHCYFIFICQGDEHAEEAFSPSHAEAYCNLVRPCDSALRKASSRPSIFVYTLDGHVPFHRTCNIAAPQSKRILDLKRMTPLRTPMTHGLHSNVKAGPHRLHPRHNEHCLIHVQGNSGRFRCCEQALFVRNTPPRYSSHSESRIHIPINGDKKTRPLWGREFPIQL
jgi:hypothetical protein